MRRMPITNRRLPAVAAVVVFAVHGAIILGWGIRVPPDSVMFSRWADLLIANHFDFAAVVRSQPGINVPAGLYMPFVMLVVLTKLIAGARWASLLVASNLVLDAMTAAILIRLVILATRSSAAAMLALAAWLVCFELATWVRMPLTDVPFLFTSFAAFAVLATPSLTGGRHTKRSLASAALLTLASLLLRPVGFLWLILMTVVYLVTSGRVRFRRAAGVALVVAAVVLGVHTFVVRHPESWPIDTLTKGVRWDARSYQRGEVIEARPEMAHRRPTTIADYAAITADRFVHFFAFSTASFSRTHNIAGAAFYGTLYLLGIIAVVAGARSDRDAAVIVRLSLAIVLAVAFWHSLVIIDFDWRYRLPVLPHLIFIAAYAVPMMRPGITAAHQATTNPPTP